MGILDDAIREHLDLKRRHGADPSEIEQAEREALGPVRRGPEDLEADEPSEAPAPAAEELEYENDDGPSWSEPYDDENDLFGPERGAEPSFDEPPAAPEPVQRVPEPPSRAPEPPSRAPEPPADADEPDFSDEFATREHTPGPGLFDGDDEAPAAGPPPPAAPPAPPAAAPEAAPPPPQESASAAPAPPPPQESAAPAPPPPAAQPREGHVGEETAEYDVAGELDKEGEDVLEETPEFLQDTPDHDRLWFEQRPPRDFDFDG